METVFFIIVWVVSIFIASSIGSKKGRGGLGTVLGLLLGIFGVIIIAILSPDPKHQEQESLASGEMIQCPDCAEPIRSEAKVCKHCGRSLEGIEPQEKVAFTKCPSCSGLIREQSEKCKHCGIDLYWGGSL